MIDFHVHLGDVHFPASNSSALSLEQLIDTMNRLGIDMSVLLPLDSPEAAGAMAQSGARHPNCSAASYTSVLLPSA